ncbi:MULTISPECIES: hypothetical protein [unclassified Streptomyces]|uniref:hypothetical protein n=1 Tax=unclassified Streptomyces TaxID=2593676 RepID=UPI002E28EC14|nr:hypothetical protein [Streptomyces sp. NBC_00223]
MEQRIGPIVPPIHAAGFDPAYVPGITPPRPADAEVSVPAQAAASPGPEDAPEEPAATAEKVAADADADEQPESEAESEVEEDDGLPVFEISDRRGSITADRTGITFRLDGEEADFHWDEIGAVEIDTPRFGRRFTVTVYVSTRRWFEANVDATSRSQLKEWAAQLDAVLDARFEDADAEEAEEPAAVDAADAADTEADAEAEVDADNDAERKAESADAEPADETPAAKATRP